MNENENEPLIIGHRGAYDEAPENTLKGFKKAIELGADYIATGHYVRTKQNKNQTLLLKGLDTNKDQSYFLHGLQQHQLKQALFPIGELEKEKVRQIAEDAKFRYYLFYCSFVN